MYYPSLLLRRGAVPALLRLIALVLECISVLFIAVRQVDANGSHATDYLIVSCFPRRSQPLP